MVLLLILLAIFIVACKIASSDYEVKYVEYDWRGPSYEENISQAERQIKEFNERNKSCASDSLDD